MTRRHSISELGLSTGKKARLYRILHWLGRRRHPDRAGGKFYWGYAGEVPSVLKLNGRTGFLPTLRRCLW